MSELPSEPTAYEQLDAKRRRFVDAFLGEAKFNAVRAAEIAGYSTPAKQGSRIRNHPAVAAAIYERLDELAMPAQEVLAHLAAIGRGSLRDFIDVNPEYLEPTAEMYRPGDRCPRCEKERPDSVTVLRMGTVTDLTTGAQRQELLCQLCMDGWKPRQVSPWRLNLVKAKQRNQLQLLSELSFTECGPKIKLHDRLKALELIGKTHKLFVERQEHSGPDGGAIPLSLDEALTKVYGAGDVDATATGP